MLQASVWLKGQKENPVGTVTLEGSDVLVDVADPVHREAIERAFRDTGEVTFAWTPPSALEARPAPPRPGAARRGQPIDPS
jgi:hypothetical protein